MCGYCWFGTFASIPRQLNRPERIRMHELREQPCLEFQRYHLKCAKRPDYSMRIFAWHHCRARLVVPIAVHEHELTAMLRFIERVILIVMPALVFSFIAFNLLTASLFIYLFDIVHITLRRGMYDFKWYIK